MTAVLLSMNRKVIHLNLSSLFFDSLTLSFFDILFFPHLIDPN